MLQPLVSILTAASIFTHVVLGCCAHHEHAPTAAVELATIQVDNHGCSQSHCPCNNDEHEAPAQSCDGERCVYVLGQKVSIDGAFTGSPPVALVSSSVLGALDNPASVRETVAERIIEGGIRPHLLYQVLLI